MIDILEAERRKDVQGLIAALNNENGDVRALAAEALGRIGDPQAIGPLLDVHFRDPYRKSLLPAPDDPRYDYILGMGKEEEYPVREAAGAALERFEDARAVQSFVTALMNEEMLGFALGKLVKIGSAAVESLGATLKDERWNVRAKVVEALGNIANPRAVEPLILALKDEQWNVRGHAAEALGKIPDPRAVEPLIHALKDEEWVVRMYTAEALGKIADPRALDSLNIALKDENISVRNSAQSAWRIVRAKNRPIEPLIIALRNEQPSIRGEAAVALGEIGNEQALEPLILALKDEYWSVRSKAAKALGEIGDIRAVESLKNTLEDEVRLVSEAANIALEMICVRNS